MEQEKRVTARIATEDALRGGLRRQPSRRQRGNRRWSRGFDSAAEHLRARESVYMPDGTDEHRGGPATSDGGSAATMARQRWRVKREGSRGGGARLWAL